MTRAEERQEDRLQPALTDKTDLLTRVENSAGTLVASYEYDALNRRIEKDVAGGDTVRFYWTGQQTIEETDDAATPDVQRVYVWGGTYIDELIQFIDSTGTGDIAYFAAHHHNFNVVILLDTSGTVVERYDYNPYGERFVLDVDFSADADGNSDVGNPIGHQGLMHDEETRLIYNRARVLHPTLGRFVQRDPLGYVDGMSVYFYSSQHLDPSGLKKDRWQGYVGGVGVEVYLGIGGGVSVDGSYTFHDCCDSSGTKHVGGKKRLEVSINVEGGIGIGAKVKTPLGTVSAIAKGPGVSVSAGGFRESECNKPLGGCFWVRGGNKYNFRISGGASVLIAGVSVSANAHESIEIDAKICPNQGWHPVDGGVKLCGGATGSVHWSIGPWKGGTDWDLGRNSGCTYLVKW